MAKKKRRRIKPADSHTPDLTPLCEAEDCREFPFYGVRLPALDRRLWVCHTHWRYYIFDSMRAKTKAWHKEQLDAFEARVQAWLERQTVLVRLEVERDDAGPFWFRPVKVTGAGRELTVYLLGFFGWRPYRWRSALTLAEVR